jgi:hypothetical protein
VSAFMFVLTLLRAWSTRLATELHESLSIQFAPLNDPELDLDC